MTTDGPLLDGDRLMEKKPKEFPRDGQRLETDEKEERKNEEQNAEELPIPDFTKVIQTPKKDANSSYMHKNR